MSSLDTEWAAFLQQHNDTTSNFGLNLNGTLETGNTNPPLEKLPVPETNVNSQEENKSICEEELAYFYKNKSIIFEYAD